MERNFNNNIWQNSWLLLLLFVSCTFNSSSEIVKDSSMEPSIIKYLALGDSYTIGESVPANENYPNLLVDFLRTKNIAVEDAQIIAKTGWTTDELNAAIQEASPDTSFQLVSLLIGVNNQYRGRSSEQYALEFEDLLQQAIRFAASDRSRVFVVSIPDYAFTPFGQGREPAKISKELDVFNAINQSITAKYNITYFNITPISREGLNQPELVASDELHPSGEQYKQWVELMGADVHSLLNN